MRHVYECPVRWADLDPLQHVNNVVYVDYLQEARVDMLRRHARADQAEGLVEGLVVVSHDVTYRAPLHFRFGTVRIECWVVSVRAATFTLAYEIFDEEPDGSRTVYLQATTVLTPYVFADERPRRITAEEKEVLATYLEEGDLPARSAATPSRHLPGGHYPVQVRFSDVDVYGHVNNVKYFEYLQEARIAMMGGLWDEVPASTPRTAMVVARIEMDYRVPILHRAEPYAAWSWVSHVGRTSVVIESEILDGSTTLARARVVLVFVDAETGRASAPAAEVRDALATMLPAQG